MTKNAVYYSLIAILLTICGFIFLVSQHQSSLAINMSVPEKFRGVCCLGCSPLVIELSEAGAIRFENVVVSEHQLINHLKQHHLVQPIHYIAISSGFSTTTNKMIVLTDKIKGYFPEARISWSVNKTT